MEWEVQQQWVRLLFHRHLLPLRLPPLPPLLQALVQGLVVAVALVAEVLPLEPLVDPVARMELQPLLLEQPC